MFSKLPIVKRLRRNIRNLQILATQLQNQVDEKHQEVIDLKAQLHNAVHKYEHRIDQLKDELYDLDIAYENLHRAYIQAQVSLKGDK
jgi:uncharacterized protein Yka (UPF0111/DUF47 family)